MAKLKTLIYFFLVMLFVNNILAQGEDPFDALIPLTTHLESTTQLDHLLNTTDNTYLMYYYSRSSKNSKSGAIIMKEVLEKLKNLVEILLIDCDSAYGEVAPPCQRSNVTDVDIFPRVFIERPPDMRFNPYTGEQLKFIEKRFVESTFSSVKIHNFITENIPAARLTILDTDNIDQFLR